MASESRRKPESGISRPQDDGELEDRDGQRKRAHGFDDDRRLLRFKQLVSSQDREREIERVR